MLLPTLIGTSGSYEVIVFGIVLVLVLKYLPDGLWSLVGRWLPRAAARRSTGRSAGALPERSQAGARRDGAGGGQASASSSAAWSP